MIATSSCLRTHWTKQRISMEVPGCWIPHITNKVHAPCVNTCACWRKMVNSVHILIIFPFKHSYEKGICVGKGDLCWDWTLGWCPKFDTFFLKMLWFRSWSNKKDVIHIHLWLCNPFHYYVLFNVVITFVHDV
jgi:hypothetical protein